MEQAKAVELKGFIDYSADSVVSKTLLNKKSGTLTLFAFDKGQGLSEHTAPFDAVVYILDGKAELKIGGKPVIASPGEMVIMPANVPHSVNAIERFKMLLIMIREV
ncbi:MAG: cupin domain-containing protein [Candidatus Omnitrophica bacterium]|nr:cupin domain-containing protein [Candidatus Omnitrophota bacterium]